MLRCEPERANHQPLETDPEWPQVLRELREFLAPGTTAAPTPRDLAGAGRTRPMPAQQTEVLRLLQMAQPPSMTWIWPVV